MKLVTAIIKPHLVEGVTEALDSMDVSGMTLTEVRGHGRQRGHSEVYRGGEYRVDFLPKVRIEVLVKDGETERSANTIIEKARTGQIGDGKLWVQAVEATVRIRTGRGRRRSALTRARRLPAGTRRRELDKGPGRHGRVPSRRRWVPDASDGLPLCR